MKINGLNGEFAFHCLKPSIFEGSHYWVISDDYFFSKEEAQKHYGTLDIKWPVQVYEDGSVYIPHESELKEGN